MYRVIVGFTDLKDEGHQYQIGDPFPFDGKKISRERIKELTTDKNLIGKPLIERIYVRKKKEV